MTRTTAHCRTTAKNAASVRQGELKHILLARQRELVLALRGKIRDQRADESAAPHDVLDEAEASQVDSQADVDFALLELKAEMLDRITAALSHLEVGSYGRCEECGDDIAEARLRALPFAARCKECEERREAAAMRQRSQGRQALSPLGFRTDGTSLMR